MFTKASAIYTPELSAALAWTFQHALQWVGDSDPWRSSIVTEGLENQLVNEVTLSSCWSLSNSWKFKNKQRINLLAMRSVEKLVEKQAKKGPRRFCCLVDSNVCRGALGKGRSASLALSSVLRRISACQVTFGLYLTIPFCPTRLNIADDPTRERELRQPVVGCGWKTMSKQELWDIAMLPRLRSNWLRLMLLLLRASLKSWSDRNSFRLSRITEPVLFGQGQPCPSCPDIDYSCFDFDAAMGYPGEGPARLITNFIVFLCVAGSCLEFPSLSHQCRLLLFWFSWFSLSFTPSALSSHAWVLRAALAGSCAVVPACAMEPANAADQARALARAMRPPLPACWTTNFRTREQAEAEILECF